MTEVFDLQGHWRRLWLRAPGFEDAQTAVHWLQCGEVYADIRLPADSPDCTGATALADLPDPVLLQLAAAEGFAGTIAVGHDVCTWDRRINWHGQPETVDAGLLEWDADGRLIETGVHADYAELWERTTGPSEAMHLRATGIEAFLVTVGENFVFGAGRPGAPRASAALDLLRVGKRTSELTLFFDLPFVLGRWQGQAGVVLSATNPLLNGTRIITNGDGVTWHKTGFLGDTADIALTPV